ncbi:MAG: VWA domain-containing protein [Arcobacter sp.]|nr:MAG: VWA domain-containing protein [Arcobacter sp.]
MFDNLLLIKFEYPYVLLLIILFIVCNRYCKARMESYYMPHLEIFENSKDLQSSFIGILKWLTIISAIIALSSPIKELDIIQNKKDGIDMIVALDTSRSMSARGFNPSYMEQNRWQVVQEIIKDFVSKRVNDNIGIVVFGTSVMTASPLSYDKKAQLKILEGLNIGIVGEKTALINSIATSINILKQKETKTKIIIAVTDGEDTASNIPLSVVIKLAKKYNIKIYTIAIGATNTYTLEQLSSSTSGKTFVAYTKSDLQDIYNTIDKLEKSKIDQNKIIVKEYYFFYPLMLGFLSLLFFVYFKNKRESF